MKKISLIILLMLSSFCFLCACKEEKEQDFHRVVYSLSENGEYYICKGVWSFDGFTDSDKHELIIEAYICGKPVLEIANNAFHFGHMKRLVIPDTVERIGDYAFEYCSELEEIVFSKNLKSIGKYAFNKCENIKKIELPNSLDSIDDYCFIYATSLKEFYIPNSVVNIGDSILKYSNNTEIKVYCEVEKKLDTWHENCFAGLSIDSIIYNYKNSI